MVTGLADGLPFMRTSLLINPPMSLFVPMTDALQMDIAAVMIQGQTPSPSLGC